MYYVEIFDRDRYKRFVGGGVSVLSATTLAEDDARRSYPNEVLKFKKDKSGEPGFLLNAPMSEGLRYRIRISQDELDRIVESQH